MKYIPICPPYGRPKTLLPEEVVVLNGKHTQNQDQEEDAGVTCV